MQTASGAHFSQQILQLAVDSEPDTMPSQGFSSLPSRLRKHFGLSKRKPAKTNTALFQKAITTSTHGGNPSGPAQNKVRDL